MLVILLIVFTVYVLSRDREEKGRGRGMKNRLCSRDEEVNIGECTKDTVGGLETDWGLVKD